MLKRKKPSPRKLPKREEQQSTTDSQEDEKMALSVQKMLNIISSDSESDIDKRNSCDSDLDADVEQILQELIIEENTENISQEETAMELSKWSEYSGRQKMFTFTGKSGINKKLPNTINACDVFSLFVDDKVINLIVTETNRYAEQQLNKSKTSTSAQMQQWTPTNPNEIKKFMGLILWMDLIKTKPAGSYWTKKPLFDFNLPQIIMPQNRFELLLSNFHFADNTTIASGNRLDKIFSLLDTLQENYQKIFTPGEHIIINETLIPWHGKLIFNQYIPKKAHKYGIKLFKLCTPEGFTWSMRIYSGKSADGIRETGLAYNVCLQLAEKLFDEGRTIYIDNFYTSYELAISCLKQKTHIVGTVKNNKKYMPKDILQSKLEKGKMISKEDNNGIVILKWRNSRDVKILSTKHVPLMLPCIKHRHNINAASNVKQSCVKLKPIAVIEHDAKKRIIDHSEQLISHATTIIKGLKWYKKLGIQLLLGISVANAFVIYNQTTKKNIQIEQFREILAQELLEILIQ